MTALPDVKVLYAATVWPAVVTFGLDHVIAFFAMREKAFILLATSVGRVDDAFGW